MYKSVCSVAIIIGLGLGSLPAQSMPEGDLNGLSTDVEESSTFTVFGKALSWSVTESDVERTPEWLGPERQEPPLSVSAAVAASKAELGRYLPAVVEWKLDQVSIKQLGWGSKWFYVVEWRAARHHQGDSLGIPVLMSGSPVRLHATK